MFNAKNLEIPSSTALTAYMEIQKYCSRNIEKITLDRELEDLSVEDVYRLWYRMSKEKAINEGIKKGLDDDEFDSFMEQNEEDYFINFEPESIFRVPRDGKAHQTLTKWFAFFAEALQLTFEINEVTDFDSEYIYLDCVMENGFDISDLLEMVGLKDTDIYLTEEQIDEEPKPKELPF